MSGQGICLCGAAAGYTHKRDCPRPLYRTTDAGEARWLEEREALRQALDAAGARWRSRWAVSA